jgi:hypothetical protein
MDSVCPAVKVGNNVEKRGRISLTNQAKRRENEYIKYGTLELRSTQEKINK